MAESEHQAAPSYPPETAGSIMVARGKVPTVLSGADLSTLKNLLAEQSHQYATINYIYVVDHENHIVGVFSIKEFFQKQQVRQHVDDIMRMNVVSVSPDTDQERVALLALQNNIKAVPVVDDRGVMLGVVPPDSVLKVLNQEAVEDVLRVGGIYHKGGLDDLRRLSVRKAVQHRLPWLLIGMVGGLLAAGIIGRFEGTLSRNLVLAAFIPLVVYMADAVGTQMETFIIRDLAINPTLKFISYFFKQARIALLIGLLTGILLAMTGYLLYRDARLSTVLGIALFLATMSSVVSGLGVPYLFRKLRFDPANASGPIGTIIQDILSVLVYFVTASLLL
ncbi:MAG: magnesium transporter [Chloroflexi bacterium]|nr:magnesium transporter [Chloroflexota bacterium]